MLQYNIYYSLDDTAMLNAWRTTVTTYKWLIRTGRHFIYCLIYIVIFSLFFSMTSLHQRICIYMLRLYAFMGFMRDRGCHVIIIYPNVRGPSTDIIVHKSICGYYITFSRILYEYFQRFQYIRPRDTIYICKPIIHIINLYPFRRNSFGYIIYTNCSLCR